jgi:transcriptional regulator with XRE-family HTH domain
MDIAKSIRLSLADINERQPWLAGRLGVTRAYVNRMANGTIVPGGKKIEEIAEVFGMTVSEFIALGEK